MSGKVREVWVGEQEDGEPIRSALSVGRLNDCPRVTLYVPTDALPSPFAAFSSTACWKLTSHLEEFINGEAVKGDRADGEACNWAAAALKQLWARIGELDNEVRRATVNPPERVSGPVGRVMDGITVDAEGKVA